MPGIHIDFTADNSNIVSVFKETNARMEQLSDFMKMLSDNGLDMSSSEQSVESLKTYLSGLEGTLDECTDKMKELYEAQKEAMAVGDTAGVEEYGAQLEKYAEVADGLAETIGVTKEAIDLLDKSEKQNVETLEQKEGVMVKLLGGQEKYDAILKGLPPGLKSAVTGLNGMVGAAKAFIATPLGAVLAALILAFKTISTWLHKSSEGQKVLAKISGTLSGILSGLQQIVMNVGKFLYNAFNDPKKAAKDFVAFLKSQVVNRVQAIGEMFESLGKVISNVFKADFDAAKEGLTDMGKAFVKFQTGIEADKITGAIGKVADIAKAQSELSQRSFKLRQDRMAFITEEAELDRQIAEARSNMYIGSSSEKQAAAAKVQELINQKTEKQIALAREEYEIKKASNALTDSSVEDLEEEAQLQARVIQLETESINAKARAMRVEDSASRQQEKLAQQAANLAERRRAAEEKLLAELNNLVRSNEDSMIELLEEGGEKRVAIIESNFRKQIEAIKKQREDWARQNKEASGSEDLLPSQIKAINDAVFIAEMNRDKELNDLREQSYKEFIQAYGNRKEQEFLLTKEYNKKLEAAEKDDIYAREKIRRDYEKAMRDLDDKYGASYALVFADAGLLSDTLLEKAIEETNRRIKEAKDSGDIQALSKLYERLRDQLTEQSGRSEWGFNGIASGMKELAEARKAMEKSESSEDLDKATIDQNAAYDKIKKSVSEITSAFGELGKMLSEFGGVLGGIGSMFSEMSSHASDFEKALSGTAKKGDAISAAFSFTLDMASMIASSIKENKKAQEEWNKTIRQAAHEYEMLQLEALNYKQQNIFGVENPYKKAIDGATQYRDAMEKLNEKVADLNKGQVQTGTKKAVNWKNVGKGAGGGAAAGAVVGSVFGPIGAAIGAAAGALTGAIAGLLSTKTVPVFESLTKKYGELYDENYILNQKLVADYNKLDDETKQIVDNWEEIVSKAKESEEQMRETFSELAGDVGNQLADSLVSAFRNGDLYAAIDDFHSKMTGTIENIMEQLVFSSTFGAMFDELQQRMNDSFGKEGDGDIVDDLIWMEKEYQNSLDNYNQAMLQVQDSLRNLGYDAWASDSEVKETGATSGTFKTMSESTGEALEGRFTAIQISNQSIADSSLAIKNTISDMRGMLMVSMGYLDQIEVHTRRLKSVEDRLGQIEKNTRNI